MLVVILIIFFGNLFYTLADKYDKIRWLSALIGMLIYYGTMHLYRLLYVIIYSLIYSDEYIERIDEFTFNYVAIFIGILVTYISYYWLKGNWKKKEKKETGNIDDIGRS